MPPACRSRSVAFLAGMMLAESEFRHQVEATIRSYRDVLLGLFFITIGMLLDFRLLLRHLALVTAILAGMLVLKTAIVAVAAKPAAKSWFKSIRTGVIVSQGGEFGFALLTLLLRDRLLEPAGRAAAACRDRAQHGRCRRWSFATTARSRARCSARRGRRRASFPGMRARRSRSARASTS